MRINLITLYTLGVAGLLGALGGGCSAGGTAVPGQPAHETSGFELSLTPDSNPGAGDLAVARLDVTLDGSLAVVSIAASGAQALKSLYCDLKYDAALYAPVDMRPAAAWSANGMELCLAEMGDPGTVHYGQVAAQWDRCDGFSGDGVVATARFRRQSGGAAGIAVRRVSAAPCSKASKSPLSWDAATGTLRWLHYHQGDYNQDGMVTVSDLTPMGVHYNTAGPFDCTTALSCVDGNSDGYITVSDITPIGMNYNSRTGGYRVYISDEPDKEYPAEASTPSIISARTELGFSVAQGDKATERKWFSFVIDEPQPGDSYWVRPVDGETEGIPSNIVNDSQWRQWQTYTVDQAGDVGFYCTLDLDAADQPHIGYYDADNGDLKYAFFNGMSWWTEVIDAVNNTGGFCSLALDSLGNPHLSYRDDSEHVLRYAHRDGDTWHKETVDSHGNVGQYTDIAIDSNDRPCISYCDEYPNGNLKFARHDGTGWAIEFVDDSLEVEGTTSLALDSNDYPHISYRRPGQLRYAYWDGAEWQGLAVRWFEVGKYNSIALDSNDHPHLTCFHSWQREPKYSMFDGTEWQHSTIATGGDLGWFTSIVIDADDRPHVSFAEGADGDLYYSYLAEGGEWVVELVASAGDIGYYSSLVLDSGGVPHIAYYDLGEGDLLYATP